MENLNLKKIRNNVWEINKSKDMTVPARVYSNKELLKEITDDYKKDPNRSAIKQLINFSTLPGIKKYSIALPDMHVGYGFPIGGAAAFDINEGVVSFSAIGFDSNCGVRNMITPFTKKDIESKQKEILKELFQKIPAGLGSKGNLKLNKEEIDEVLEKGAKYVIDRGYGIKEDLEFIEENGCMKDANPENVSNKAKQRQFKQVGTLGSGNHYLELQYVSDIFDEKVAKTYGLKKDQVIISIHTGSRALGHQTGTDYLSILSKASKKYNIPVKERELVCAPIQSEEGQKYISAEFAAFNCAFANRQVIAHLARNALSKIFDTDRNEIKTLYDVGHNTCKFEKHKIGKKSETLLVHRKGSTRAFGPNRKEIPTKYRKVGQPVLIGGTMGTSSYILHGTEEGMNETFGSSAHGAGRKMSRTQAKKLYKGETIVNDLNKKGIFVRGHGFKGVAEESPEAYKDVNSVVEVLHKTGISKKVVKTKPLVCIKG